MTTLQQSLLDLFFDEVLFSAPQSLFSELYRSDETIIANPVQIFVCEDSKPLESIGRVFDRSDTVRLAYCLEHLEPMLPIDGLTLRAMEVIR